ncbi:hypothetical protein J3F83DRAFT_727179 [Trichoderma novae-zelandiae]
MSSPLNPVKLLWLLCTIICVLCHPSGICFGADNHQDRPWRNLVHVSESIKSKDLVDATPWHSLRRARVEAARGVVVLPALVNVSSQSLCSGRVGRKYRKA